MRIVEKMTRAGQILVEILLAAILLVFVIPIVRQWSEDAGNKTLLKKVEQEASHDYNPNYRPPERSQKRRHSTAKAGMTHD